MNSLLAICAYLALLLGIGYFSNRWFRGTPKDYFAASHSIGPFLLLLSIFGATMTAFAIVGSTSKAYERGIGIYGLMASISGLVHAGVFYLVGIRLWAFGKRYGYLTQIQFFRARFESQGLGYLLFPILVGMVIPYLLIGLISAGKTLLPVTKGAFPELFANPLTPQWAGGIPPWLTQLVVCAVVLYYIFAGGARGATWANALQTIIFLGVGGLAFVLIAQNLGGFERASNLVARVAPDGRVLQTHAYDKTTRTVVELPKPKVIGQAKEPPGRELLPHLSRTVVGVTLNAKDPKTGEMSAFEREWGIAPMMFLTYLFVPLSVGMFPHLFQHWLTAKSARSFRLTVVLHPLCIMIVWLPCVMIGAWASGILPNLTSSQSASVLGSMVSQLAGSEALTVFLTAGIFSAIISSLDSQFLALGAIFTFDLVLQHAKPGRFTDRQVVWMARGFITLIALITYLCSLLADRNVFDLGIWCFSGFSSLFPLAVAAVYWRRATKAGAIASVLVALSAWLYLFLQHGQGGEEYTLPGRIMPAALLFALSASTLVIVSLLTKPPSAATINRFFPAKLSPGA